MYIGSYVNDRFAKWNSCVPLDIISEYMSQIYMPYSSFVKRFCTYSCIGPRYDVSCCYMKPFYFFPEYWKKYIIFIFFQNFNNFKTIKLYKSFINLGEHVPHISCILPNEYGDDLGLYYEIDRHCLMMNCN